MKNKIIILALLLAVISLFSISTISQEPSIDCCINTHPNILDESICKDGVTKATCCNADTVGTGGPEDIQVCEADYFNAGGCEVFTEGQCDTACCCKNAEALKPSPIPIILCTERYDGVYAQPADPSQTCTQVCSGVTTECGNDVCEIPEEDSVSCPEDCPLVSECSNPAYKPKLSGLEIRPEQGKDKMILTWNDECPNNVNRYAITRCLAPQCPAETAVAFPPITQNRFIDTSDSLKFKTDYIYKIQGEYSAGQKSNASAIGNLGNFECLTQAAANKKFCIQPSYYDQFEIREYLARSGETPNSTTYNSGYQCQSGNRLALVRACGEGKACAIFEENVECVVGGSACNFPEGNPFGLYYTRAECEGSSQADYKYCFLDRSTTPVDNCYQCTPTMVCYDYKSSGACISDNCNVGNCQWAGVEGLSSLGIGVCIDPAKDNCKYCSAQGSPGASNLGSFNTIYDICTQAKLNALTNNQSCGCTAAGQTRPCPETHPTEGKCRKGTQTCSADLTWGICAGVIYPDETETCANSIDDDCDGVVDDGCAETLCDGNDNNNNGFRDEGFGDWDRDNNGQCNFLDNPLLCGADCVDRDLDGDNVLDTGPNPPAGVSPGPDKQNLTEIGCIVYNQSIGSPANIWGVGIDMDGDKRCLGVDCNDMNKSIQINCPLSQTCSNQFKDREEEEVDCGGICPPCKIKDMTMNSPRFGISSTFTFPLEFSTNRPGTCRYYLDNKYINYANMKSLDVSGDKIHKTQNFKDISDEAEHQIYIRCIDEHYTRDEDIPKFAFNLSVDTSPPRFHPENPQADPNPVIQVFSGASSPQTNLKVYTDDKTICKYGTINSWAGLDGKFEGYENNTFKTFHQQTLALPSTPQANYNYYIGCRNPAEPEMLSDLFLRLISVDLLQKIAVKDYTRKSYAGPPNDPVVLNISANKLTDNCFWGEEATENKINQPFPSPKAKGGEYFYSVARDKTINGTPLGEGNYDFYSMCVLEGDKSAIISTSVIIDKTPPSKPIVNDSSKYENNSEITWVTYELQLKLYSEDNASGISYYTYWLEDSKKKTIQNFTNTTKHNDAFMVTGLNLTNGETYYFSAKAYDLANLASEVGKSDGIKVDTSKIPPTCLDSLKNGDETSEDCGGKLCNACANNQTCKVNDDCLSKACSTAKIPYVCVAASCEDDIMNGDETDVDCGGKCTAKCGIGKKCMKDADCVQGKCDASSKACTGIDTCSNNKLDIDETDVDCGGEKCGKCPADSICDINADCISGWCDPEAKKCNVPSCQDGKKNWDEDAVDCGGSCNACDGTLGGDRDSDGLPDDWEDRYCNGDCNPDDDEDGEGLTNIIEYRERTDPTNEDTDDDGWTDKDEVDEGTDPNDADSHPETSILLTFLIVLGIIALLFVAGYFGYTYYYLPKMKKKVPISPLRMFEKLAKPEEKFLKPSKPEEKPIPPIIPTKPAGLTQEQLKRREEIKELLEKRRKQREEARKKVFEVFGITPKEEKPAEKEKKEEEKKPLREEKPVEKKKAKLKHKKPLPKPKIAPKPAPKESAIERLAKIAKKK